MFRFPFYGYHYNYPYYRYYNKSINNVSNTEVEKPKTVQQTEEIENSITNSRKISNTINKNSDSTQPIFEIFGIKIYTDDLIIIGLLYFLYKQNVKDEMLYIILFLLLVS